MQFRFFRWLVDGTKIWWWWKMMMTTLRMMMMLLSLSHSPDWGVLPWTGHKFNPEAAILPSCLPAILAYSPDGLTLLIYIFFAYICNQTFNQTWTFFLFAVNLISQSLIYHFTFKFATKSFAARWSLPCPENFIWLKRLSLNKQFT